jgi:hypothetical protein
MNLDRRLDNRTPMEVRCLPVEGPGGHASLVVVAKLTWAVSPRGEAQIALPQRPIRTADEPSGLPGPAPSIRYPNDVVDEKPGTDVLLVGTAYPPAGRAVSEVHVSLQVGSLAKAVRVVGPRVFQTTALGGIGPGPSAAVGPTPLVYELSHGGFDDADPTRVVIDPQNPSGVGVCRAPATLVGKRAPQIELAPSPIGGRSTAPAGFGAILRQASPRRELAGTFDAAWRRDRAPLRPVDFDPRHNCVAHPDLRSPTPLVGDEPVEVLGATPGGVWRFKLPRHAPSFFARRLERDLATGRLEPRVAELPTHLDTFLVDADQGAVELVWRACIRMPPKIDHLEAIVVRSAPALPAAIVADLARRTPSDREAESLS